MDRSLGTRERDVDTPQAAGRDHGWWPYLVPYFGFLALVEIGGRLPPSLAPWMLPVKVLVPGALFLAYRARGRYPELGGWRPGAFGLAGDAGMGLAIAAVWMLPYLAFGWLPRPDPAQGFDPGMLGASLAPATLALRGLGFVLVTPFVEELFVRSFLLRYLEVYDRERDFRAVPIARFGWRSFAGTVLVFTITHAPWEMPVAFVTGILFNLWLYRRGHLGSVVLAHAVANGTIFAVVVGAGDAVPALRPFL